MSDDSPKCGTFKLTPSDPDDPTARLSKEVEAALRLSIECGIASPSIRVLYGELSATRNELQDFRDNGASAEQYDLMRTDRDRLAAEVERLTKERDASRAIGERQKFHIGMLHEEVALGYRARDTALRDLAQARGEVDRLMRVADNYEADRNALRERVRAVEAERDEARTRIAAAMKEEREACASLLYQQSKERAAMAEGERSVNVGLLRRIEASTFRWAAQIIESDREQAKEEP